MTQNPLVDSQLNWDKNIEQNEEEEDYFDYFYDQPGNEPGTISIDPRAKPSQIILIEYNQDHATRRLKVKPSQCLSCLENDFISWVDIQGLGSEVILRKIGEIFKLHPLVLEDVVNVPQRPKVEEYDDQLLIIAHLVTPTADEKGFENEQIGFVLGKNYLLTFQEDRNEYFEPVSDRLKINKGKVRELGADYLTYLLLDALIDSYFPVLEDYGERIEDLEDQIVLKPDEGILQQIYHVRRELLALRRSIWPLRSILNLLMRDKTELISHEVQLYLRDCYDHTIQILDIVEAYRELASSLMEVYLSSMSNRMNEVMNLLTMISTIFIPLTFIAGIYGMNFEHMPELTGRWSYFICLGVMFVIALVLIFFFWRKGWFKLFYTKN